MKNISPGELDWYVQNHFLIIDLRSPQEYARVHIKGAVNVPYGKFDKELSGIGNKPVVLYCERGGLSMAVARELKEKGYQTRSVVGGIRAYRGSNMTGFGNT